MTKDYLSDNLLEGIRSGELGVIYCEPLANFPLNMVFCPEREKCQDLEDALSLDDDAGNLIPSSLPDVAWSVQIGFCEWCKSDMWLLVATDKKTLMCYTITEDFAEQIKGEVDEHENSRSGWERQISHEHLRRKG